MATIELVFNIPDELHDRCIAELDSLGSGGFVQEQGVLKAYFVATDWSSQKKTGVTQWLYRHGIDTEWQERLIPDQNWNEPWEQSIRPLQIGKFMIHPSWTSGEVDAPGSLIPIVIDPKMSFGTGYHETTRMMLQMLPNYIREGDVVLDAGAGTAILAIAAVKIGASCCVAFDNDSWASENARENILRNQVEPRVVFEHGTIEDVDEMEFDVILANINRSVLIDYAGPFEGRLRNSGVVLITGLLPQDKPAVVSEYVAAGLVLVDERLEGEWWGGVFKKNRVPRGA